LKISRPIRSLIENCFVEFIVGCTWEDIWFQCYSFRSLFPRARMMGNKYWNSFNSTIKNSSYLS
jgi:hypothetical protein